MKFFKTTVVLLALCTAGFAADKKTLLDVSRDVADVQDQVRTLQRTLDEKLAVITTQLQQTLDMSTRANSSVANLQGGISERLSDASKTLTAPVATMNTRMDQMSTDMQALREAVNDLTQRMGKLQTQVGDLTNTLKVMQSPVAPPPGSGGAPGPGGTSLAPATTSTSGGPPAGMTARDLYDAAQGDHSSGNFDLSMQEFNQYLQFYPATPLAPNAQFYIGQLYYDKGDFPSAIKAFDAVLERYPDNTKTPDATYMKGMSLWKSGQATAAGRTFLEVIQKYPKSDVAPKAKDARKALGLSVPSASTGSKAHKRKRT